MPVAARPRTLHRLSVRTLRHAARSLRRRPVFSAVAIMTLALGIGANTAIFSIVNVVLLKPLPFRDPDRLVMVWSTAPVQGLVEGFASYPDFHDWREQARAFEGLATFWTFPNGDVNLTGGSEPQRVAVARVSTGFFEVLGVAPLYGRTFLEEESVVGNHRRAILSHGLWLRDFGGDSTLVGRSVMVNGFPYEVVGIMPPELQSRSVHILGTDVQLWRPIVPEDNQTGGRDARKLRVVGRLAVGVTQLQAQSELAAIATRLAEAHPETNRETGIRVVALREEVVRDVRRGLMFLLAAVGIVLIGACVNVANLMLMKAAASRKLIAVQHALGASRLRLSAQVLAECLLLGGSGAIVGVLLAFGIVRAVVALGPTDIPLLSDARIDTPVLAFTVATTLLTVVLVGLVPAWRSRQPEVTTVLRQAGSRSREKRDRRLMSLLTMAQIALAIVLLTAGGLMVRSFQALLRVDPGLTIERVLTFKLELPMGMGTTYPAQTQRDAFFATLLERVEGLPGVDAATFASAPPLEEEPSSFTFTRPGVEDGRVLRANFRMVAPDYFALLGIPITRGRPFDATDGRAAARVVIASATLARSVWGSGDPVGARIDMPNGGQAEVVGVAGDVRTTGLDGDVGRTVYVPALQGGYNFMTVVVKSDNDPRRIAQPIRQLVRELDADLPLHHVRTLEELVAGSVAQQRFRMLLVGSFSLLVLALAVIGTYGVTSYGVSERSGELGLRVALGARREDIWRLVMRDGGRVVVAGIALGGAAAAAFSRVLDRFVFQISTLDLVTFTAAPVLLALAALLAMAIPAHRATRVDPMRVLRTD
ncbi:MAG: ABC transporter permease [Gemmatimonadaceae bacterium]